MLHVDFIEPLAVPDLFIPNVLKLKPRKLSLKHFAFVPINFHCLRPYSGSNCL